MRMIASTADHSPPTDAYREVGGRAASGTKADAYREVGDVIPTRPLQQAESLARAVLDAGSGRIGRIIGPSGTGKTIASHHLAKTLNGVRVCASAGLSRKTLLARLCRPLTLSERGTTDALLERIARATGGRLIIIDEANHLHWQHLEMLRYLPDEAGAGLLLIGTALLERPFRDGRTAVLLAQLARRIGAKQLRIAAMTGPEEIAAWVLQPRFGKVGRATAQAFYRTSQGYWGEAAELAAACRRVMTVEKLPVLNQTVVEAASRWIAPREPERA